MVKPIGNPGGIAPVDRPNVTSAPGRSAATGPSFQAVLQDALRPQGVKLSGHAQERLRSRQIDLSPDRMRRIEDGIARATQKGSRESLILVDDIALVVSVRNNVVITAATGRELKDSVFTNIDSAVIV